MDSSLEPRQQRILLVVSSQASFRSAIKQNLVPAGYRVVESVTQAEAASVMERETIDVVLMDLEKLPKLEIDLVHYIKTRAPLTEVVIATTIHEIEDATKALRNGAAFYLVKPIDFASLKAILQKLARRQQRQSEFGELEQRILADLMVGSPAMQKVLKLALKIAPTSSTVLLSGESGTGKEFFARIIHRMSGRQEGLFVAMNCGSIPDTLFESELFGHKKGAFTGADSDKPGLVEEAHLGTLFFDEIGELSLMAQVKLLRFLQERSFRRVGETTLRMVNTRILAASNRDLEQMVREGRFREDLYYRIKVFHIVLPPLRERRETIPNLIKLNVHRLNAVLGKHVTRISHNAEVILANYSYPGNVRELENIIEHAMVMCDGDEITEKDLPDYLFRNRLLLTAPPSTSVGEIYSLRDMEREHIQRVLEALNHNYTESAKKLGISRSTLWRKIKEYGISTSDRPQIAEQI